KKRSRVTPEQLVHLERYFTVDRSPTAARRREISDLLGMQERQTQIWFQNRRAKAKMLDGKVKDCSATEVPLDTSPSKHDIDLHNIIHEDDAVTFLPCTDLSVGTWRRIATTVSQHDLIAYVCEGKQSLAWFILSGGNGFKMEIPFHRIVRTDFTHASPGVARVVFTLSEPPLFYLEHPMAPRLDGKTKLSWRQCSDWTEGAQATQVLRHTLFGSAPQLSHLVQRL
ncbi:homeobox-domain-containing protein, partial [Gymnopus androsaceus JB14]